MSTLNDNLNDVKSDAKERLGSDYESLKNSFAQLRSDVTTILQNAVGAGKSAGGSVAGTVSEQASGYVGQAKEQYNNLRDRGTQQVEQIGTQIGERPMTSALIAFGVGFLVAKILTRR